MSEPSSPKIHRPKPRRPYEQSSPSFPAHQSSTLLSPAPSYSDEPISRTQSILNLTSSTLLGIYSPTGYQSDRDYDVPSTPWGTGAETPQRARTRTESISDSVHVPIRRHAAPSQPPSSTTSTAAAFALRGVLLFGIGMGYGLLVRHLHDDRQLAPFQVEGIIKPRNDWRYLVFWGVAGVCLGSLMPWVDTLFSSSIEERNLASGEKRNQRPSAEKEIEEESGVFGADWTPVVRSVGAFVGIAYAIRKLPWATPLQASLTLFLVNPVLWYLIDRSAPGFILSASVGAVGTSLLLASNPDMMPSPASSTSIPTFNNTNSYDVNGDIAGIVSRESFEMGIWILSVLFCSCVCFGNVGRRLALSGGRSSVLGSR